MKPLRRVRTWLLNRLLKLEQRDSQTLREFVYVDEVSVKSLYASIYGGVLTERQESRSSDTKVGVDLHGAGSLGSGRTAGVQRTFNISTQSWFNEVRAQLARSDRLVKPSQVREGAFCAGDFFELQIELTTSGTQKMSMVVDYMVNLEKAAPSLFGSDDTNIRQVREMDALLQTILAGQVAIEGKIMDNGRPLDVRLAALLSGESFWQDPVRVVSEGQRLTVLCRARRSAFVNSWDYVRAGGLIAEYIPGFELRSLDEMFREALRGNTETITPTPLHATHLNESVTPSTDNSYDSEISDANGARLLAGLPDLIRLDTSAHAVTSDSQELGSVKFLEVQVVALYW